MNQYTFILFLKDGTKRQTTVYARSEDDAYDRVYEHYPNTKYIELF